MIVSIFCLDQCREKYLNIEYNDYLTGGQDKVYVTHIRNPCHFLVQRCGDATALKKLSYAINDHCRTTRRGDKDIPVDLKKGTFIAKAE